ncbi:hypothetical protein RIF29_17830 [Crotalaria pallida]|uniref:Uncharacterized protein n=1 Tax=Crotalaria pallida TaxID=3830 RepID=A0AAN9IKJ3_CROPI
MSRLVDIKLRQQELEKKRLVHSSLREPELEPEKKILYDIPEPEELEKMTKKLIMMALSSSSLREQLERMTPAELEKMLMATRSSSLQEQLEKMTMPEIEKMMMALRSSSLLREPEPEKKIEKKRLVHLSHFFYKYILNTDDDTVPKELAYETIKHRVMDAARSIFRPEFMNKVDEYIAVKRKENREVRRTERGDRIARRHAFALAGALAVASRSPRLAVAC